MKLALKYLTIFLSISIGLTDSIAQGETPCSFDLPGSSLASWYPDSKTLIFERSGANPGIYTVDLDGRNLKLLVPGESVGHPAVFPDGSTISFQRKKESTGNYAIVVLDSDGAEKVLSDINYQCTDVSISPSGASIAYTKKDESDNLDIYVMDLEDGDETRLTEHSSYDYSPHWSPSGEQLLFTSHRLGHPNIYLMEIDGSSIELLTTGPDEEFSSAWSPDGEKVVFSVRSSERNELQHNSSELYILNLKTGNKKRITQNYDMEVLPNWSPDGRYIAYTGCGTGNREVYILDTNTLESRKLTETKK